METAHNTIGSVLARKIADHLDGLPPRKLLRLGALTFVATLLSAGAVDVQATVNTLFHLGHWNHSALTKMVVITFLTFNGAKLVVLIRRLLPKPQAPQVDTLENIPVSELLDHLFTEKSLKVKEATAKFSVPQYRVEALVKNLKRVGVLLAGENYASVLNPEFSRQDVASILAGCEKAADLEPLFRRDALGFTSSPSAKEIRSRVEDATTPLPPVFTIRKLATA